MRNNPHGNSSQTSLNTLAQSETRQAGKLTTKQGIIVSGTGTELKNEKAVKGRAKRKMITQRMVLSLIDTANNKEHYGRNKGYWNTYHCQSKVYSSENKLYGKYCKNRFCTLCCSIRKADIINKYLPTISKWDEPYFVTLTAKSVPLKNLPKRMRDMNRGFKIISSKYRKRNQRGRGHKLTGIKSLECNFNPVTRKYNPHLHLIVANSEMAELLIKEWLSLCTPVFASRRAQHMRKVNDLERDLIEIIKYGSKIFTEPDVNKKSGKKTDRDIYAAALDNIFSAMKGCRIFDRFGFNLPNRERQRKSSFLCDYDEWIFDVKLNDWINRDSLQCLCGYTPAMELVNLLENNIDTHLE